MPVERRADVPRHHVEDLEHALEVVRRNSSTTCAGRGADTRRAVDHRLLPLAEQIVGEPEAQRRSMDSKWRLGLVGGRLEPAERLGELRRRLGRRVPAVAEVTTRWNAPGLSPPTQMGGCGFCTGLGAKPRSWTW